MLMNSSCVFTKGLSNICARDSIPCHGFRFQSLIQDYWMWLGILEWTLIAAASWPFWFWSVSQVLPLLEVFKPLSLSSASPQALSSQLLSSPLGTHFQSFLWRRLSLLPNICFSFSHQNMSRGSVNTGPCIMCYTRHHKKCLDSNDLDC